MVKVITYGTFDFLHYGHRRLLERAKALGDYLIVGVTADDFDKVRGKINVSQSLMERVEAVRATGLADEIIIEEYEGQKIDDIKRYDVDIFTVGSDWVGKFDYLNEWCKVIYLPRTEGISSSEIRAEKRALKIQILGETFIGEKFARESQYVNGVEIVDDTADAIYLVTAPGEHYAQIKAAIEKGQHVICESPIAVRERDCVELYEMAQKHDRILVEAIKTAYSTAYARLMLMVKAGAIGDVVSVDAVCTSMQDYLQGEHLKNKWNSIEAWGPTALLPVFQLLGTNPREVHIVSKFLDMEKKYDGFTKIDFVYANAVASVKVAKAAKSEGELIITGTKGYIYVPAPWWKTDYFEIRYEDQTQNRRYFYQLDGEGIRYEIVAFKRAIETGKNSDYVNRDVSIAISKIMEMCRSKEVVQI